MQWPSLHQSYTPCRASIKANEPLKSTELASDDIVWIYIADESSPATTYMSMIPDIKGLHYRLSGEQIQKIRDQFKVDGIPYYIFVDRSGKATGRPDLPPQSAQGATLRHKSYPKFTTNPPHHQTHLPF